MSPFAEIKTLTHSVCPYLYVCISVTPYLSLYKVSKATLSAARTGFQLWQPAALAMFICSVIYYLSTCASHSWRLLNSQDY